MERLTIDEIIEHCGRKTGMYEKACDVKYLETAVMGNGIKEYWEHKQVAEYLRKFKEYEDLEEQGRMIIFPCNKGDKIYEFYRECVECRLEAGETPKDIISMRRVLHFEYDGDEAYIYASQALPVRLFNNDEPICIPASEIGKTVFLSYEEAEAKLKEMRGGENGKIS